MSAAASPELVASFEKNSDWKLFSPFQSSESTLKRQPCQKDLAKPVDHVHKIPQLDLNNIDRPNFHEEFMEVWQEF